MAGMRRGDKTVFLLICFLGLFLDLVNGSLMKQRSHSSFIHRRLNSRERREMQKEILSILGLPRRPKPLLSVKRSSSAPVFMLDLYRTMANEESDKWQGASLPFHVFQSTRRPLEETFLSQADTIMSFVNVVEHNEDVFHHKAQWKEFKFDLTQIPRGEMVTAAEFRIYKGANDNFHGNMTLHITIYQVLQVLQDREPELLLLDNQEVWPTEEGWLEFDITATSNDWLMNPHYNLGLRLCVETEEAPGRSLDPDSVGLVGRRGARSKQPFMVTFFRASPAPIRTTRTTKPRRGRKKHNQSQESCEKLPSTSAARYSGDHRRVCKRHDLYVSFRDLGWQDWIIAPEGYAAFYCDGECSFPLDSHMNATNHAVVQTLAHLLKPEAVPKPCCAPTKLSATSVLYFDEKYNVILKKYRNMVAKSCGCQ
ncbi:bone morphogenetic protein 7-like isoform X1 [Chiloscyllium plagiosum]|uniref:bone morphogenetic protein 7-like isoform X1 n=1 Tax=Chiloscyllium plagiosum TaxID=36176 RepID=UPI001CB7F05C|nr:bone morphogenetic protein 7-like isoform X1 [Chiloscyllium plagiosum]